MKFKVPKLYLDTSIFGGYFDYEFEEETRILFEKIDKGEFQIVVSNTTEEELLGAPEKVKALFSILITSQITKLELTENAVKLADSYLIQKVVGKTSRTDCLHIALATIAEVDVLVSWNFKHIVNYARIKGYNAVNLSLGYKPIDIRSPKELIYNEK